MEEKMTTVLLCVLAVIAMVVLITVSVLGAVWLKGKLDELEAEIAMKNAAADLVKDIKAQPGQYRTLDDIPSLHPSPFNYSYQNRYDSYFSNRFDNTMNRLRKLETEVIDYENDSTLLERVEKLERDVQELNQFYYIPSDSDDKSLVDMVKELQEKINAKTEQTDD